MCSTPAPADRHWDGSPRTTRGPRPLHVAGNSPSRLLRAGQSSRCRRCGNRIDLYQRADQRPIALHPTELAALHVPESCRWHLGGGLAYPHGDGSPWCRIPHAVICPRRTPLCRSGPPPTRHPNPPSHRHRRLHPRLGPHRSTSCRRRQLSSPRRADAAVPLPRRARGRTHPLCGPDPPPTPLPPTGPRCCRARQHLETAAHRTTPWSTIPAG
ncbi:DUF6083 domain-containing protein [Streptomyces chartreusis]|uniref:DUF6083 domain-containing protein n=1 Tax=Streptomyces chartreusis TaxID=1969 RepID=UPI0037189660